MIVVGLTGYAGAGKDSVADILVRDYGFTKMALAEPLKRMLRNLNPIVGFEPGGYFCNCESCSEDAYPVYLEDLYEMGLTDAEIKKSEYGEEVRRLWQRFGTEAMRGEDDDYWIQTAWHAIPAQTDRLVITDVRFENEAEWIYDRLQNPNNSLWRIARPSEHPSEVHESEQMAGLLGEEVTILNDGSLEDLKEPVALAMDLLLNKQPEKTPGQMELDLEWWKWTE